jgi:hypothetical protein
VGILQLTATDVPELGFRPGSNLFQLLWCPLDHEPNFMPSPLIHWRGTDEIKAVLPSIPSVVLSEEQTNNVGGWFVPEACELHPERVVEFPPHQELSAAAQRRLAEWNLSLDADLTDRLQEYRFWDPPAEWLYIAELSVTTGTKVGGYVSWIQYPETPTCKCGRPSEHLLTIASLEPIADRRWGPIEDPEARIGRDGIGYEEMLSLRHVSGLEIGDGGDMYFFICRHCPEWPIDAVMQCG